MKFSAIINYPLSLIGLKLVRLSRLNELQELSTQPINISDIKQDIQFMGIYAKVKDFTLVGIERCYALYKAVQFIINKNINGDLVECGVWRGGSCMLMAYTLLEMGVTNRVIWLYDTFAGMVKPGEHDGAAEKIEWEKYKITEESSNWCLGELEDVKKNMVQTAYPITNIRFIKGKVEETIPEKIPPCISVLRLDTDWYDSTKHELVHLFPILSTGGILLIDDYGTWQGAKKATVEYFATQKVFINRIDSTGRLVVK